MAAHVPDDAWVCVCDFLQNSLLSRTCSRLWKLLRLRYLSYTLSGPELLALMTALRGSVDVRHLKVRCGSAPPRLASALSDLQTLPCLQVCNEARGGGGCVYQPPPPPHPQATPFPLCDSSPGLGLGLGCTTSRAVFLE